MNPGFEFKNVSFARHRKQNLIPILENFNLRISSGEFVAIIGPSGCGKTTLLHIAAGLSQPDMGEILYDGKSKHRNLGFVFQEPRLFPWASARKNIEWGLRAQNVSSLISNKISSELLKDVGLYDWANSYPHQLSIGMQKRVALARALAIESEFLFLDEPFSALDYQTRILMQRFLLSLHQKKQKSILIVTHEIEEALIADRIIVLSSRPARILADIRINLTRPREKFSSQFQKLSIEISYMLEQEVLKIAREEQLWQSALEAEPVWDLKSQINQRIAN